MLLIAIDERAHLVVPELDRAIVKRGGQQGLFWVCEGKRGSEAAAGEVRNGPRRHTGGFNEAATDDQARTEGDPLDSGRFRLELRGRVTGDVGGFSTPFEISALGARASGEPTRGLVRQERKMFKNGQTLVSIRMLGEPSQSPQVRRQGRAGARRDGKAGPRKEGRASERRKGAVA